MGHGDVRVERAWMATNLSSQILWMEVRNEDVKRIRLRAAFKKPAGLSVKDYCPSIAIERKKEANRLLMQLKTKNPSLRWRFDIGDEDLILMTKKGAEGEWTRESLVDLGAELPGIQATSLKRQKESPGETNLSKKAPPAQANFVFSGAGQPASFNFSGVKNKVTLFEKDGAPTLPPPSTPTTASASPVVS